MSDEVEPLVRSGREARADEGRAMEGTADDEPVTDFRTGSTSEPPAPNVLSREEAEERGFLADNLDLKVFPADRETLISSAEEQFAPQEVIQRLRSLPADRTFQNVADVWESLGGRIEHAPQHPSEG